MLSNIFPDMPATATTVLGICLGVRISQALFVRTYFNPDEYWQALEVAHHMVFGYGYLTWEWSEHLRGFLHPLLFAAVYWLLAVTGLDHTRLFIILPTVVQAALLAVGDVCTVMTASKLFGIRSSKFTLGCLLTSWFMGYCGVRTFSNSLETVLFSASLALWPLTRAETLQQAQERPGTTFCALLLGALCVVVRPTSGVMFLYLGLRLLWCHPRRVALLLQQVLPALTLAFSVGCGVDRVFYGQWVNVLWNFVKFNAISGLSALYGTHPWYWYFLEGLPTITTTFLPFAIAGLVIADKERRHLGYMAIVTIIAYSFNPHKEFRFLLPILPVCLIYAGHAVSRVDMWFLEHPKSPRAKWRWAAYAAVVVPNVLMFLYLGAVHQRGPISVVDHLRTVAATWKDSAASVEIGPMRVDFWMPCHSTPLYSYIHQSDVSLRILDCSPTARLSPEGSESQRFEDNPVQFLTTRFAQATPDIHGRRILPTTAKPSHAVLFDTAVPKLRAFLAEQLYTECGRFFHAHVQGDADARDDPRDVVLYCLQQG